jgi:twin arginine-targeting protein translocase, TatA/E family
MSIWHLIILVVVVVLVFGTGKLSSIGPDLGSAIRGFKKNLNGEEELNLKAQDKLEAEALFSESSVRQDNRERVSKP